MVQDFIHSVKTHPETYNVCMLFVGWITQHYGQVHSWLTIILQVFTLLSICLTAVLTLLKIIKFFKNNSGI